MEREEAMPIQGDAKTNKAIEQTLVTMFQTAERLTDGSRAPAVAGAAACMVIAEAMSVAPDQQDEFAERMLNDCLRAYGVPWNLVRNASNANQKAEVGH